MLLPIPNDPEDQVSMEDKPSEDPCKMAVLSKRGYKFKGDDWRNRSVKLHDANEEIVRRSFRFGDVEMGQSSSNEDFVLSKINSINKMMEDNFKIMNARLSLIEKDSRYIKVRVSKLEEQHRVTSDKNLHNETEGSRVQTHFEIGANLEIASQDKDRYVKWYPGNVLNTYMRNGVEMVKVEYLTRFRDKNKRTKKLQESISSDRIRPQPPPETKSFELMDKVEAYHNDGWCSGQIRMILTDDKYSIHFNRSTESIQFNISDLRIPKEWVDGVWKMAKEMEVQQAQSVKPSQEDRAKKGKAVVGKKRKATSPPVDNLAFLQREEKRPVGPRNHPIPVTPEVIHPIDPFVTPEFPRFSRLGYWMGLRGIHCVKSNHFIGVEIHLMDNTITLFHCGLHQKGIRAENTPLIQKLAVLIPAIKLELMGEEINYKAIVPFQVKKAEGLPKTRFPFNCGIFVVKILECKSLGLKNMSNINDDNAMDLRSKLCYEIFDQFMDKDFQEGCRK
ncbi:hypothetical protein Bca52824_001398 [Brassica carinata]|uniref:Agenet domain-containing protein n=1 Tax=Brassica carinata TaxID=52824 RepID=A0A8X8BDB8_BRACI|nr:hypothetical protein Bca52824_001398 [Brassica carinata]